MKPIIVFSVYSVLYLHSCPTLVQRILVNIHFTVPIHSFLLQIWHLSANCFLINENRNFYGNLVILVLPPYASPLPTHTHTHTPLAQINVALQIN